MSRRNAQAPAGQDAPSQAGNGAQGDGQKNRPVFSVGPIMTDPNNSVSAAVWERDVKLDDGREFTAHSISCEATYRDKEEQWQKSGSFRSNQIPTLIYCLQRCFDWALSQRDPKQKQG